MPERHVVLPPATAEIAVSDAFQMNDQQLGTLPTHRYDAGQMVRFTGGFPYRNAVVGDYEVVRRLPSRDGEFQYRIKSTGEPYERVVRESELEHV
jgi:hypothetical protein